MAAKKRREKQIAVRLTEREYAALEAEADECELAIADVVRRELGRVVRKWERAGVAISMKTLRADVAAELVDEATGADAPGV